MAALQVKYLIVYARFDRDGNAPFAGRDPKEACGVAARLLNGPTDPVASCWWEHGLFVVTVTPPCLHLVSGNSGGQSSQRAA